MNRAGEFISGAAFAAAFALVFVWVLVNWVTGCGEIIHTAGGSIQGECIGFFELWGMK